MGVKIHFAFCFTVAHCKIICGPLKNKIRLLLHHRSASESQSHQRVHPVWLPAPPLLCRPYQCPTQQKNTKFIVACGPQPEVQVVTVRAHSKQTCHEYVRKHTQTFFARTKLFSHSLRLLISSSYLEQEKFKFGF